MSKRVCYMSVDFSARYNACPTCGFVRAYMVGEAATAQGKEAAQCPLSGRKPTN